MTTNPIFEVRNKLLLRLMSSSVIAQLFWVNAKKVADKVYKTVPKFLKVTSISVSLFLTFKFGPKFYSTSRVRATKAKLEGTVTGDFKTFQ